MRPSPGDLLNIDGQASVQFAGDRALTFRVVSVCDRPTYAGWVWLTGYVINRAGRAIAKREVYVQLAGLRRAPIIPVVSQQRRISSIHSPRNPDPTPLIRGGAPSRTSV